MTLSGLPQYFTVNPYGELHADTSTAPSQEVSIVWDPTSGAMHVRNFPDVYDRNVDSLEVRSCVNSLSYASRFGREIARLYCAVASIPDGFTAHKVPANHDLYSRLSTQERATIRKALPKHPLVNQLLPRSGPSYHTTVRHTVGYFAPDATAHVPGTPYLFPVTGGSERLEWHVGYVGMPSKTGDHAERLSATWNDAAGMAALADACRDADPELTRVEAFVLGQPDAAHLRQAAEESAALAKARAAFRSRGLRVNRIEVMAALQRARVQAANDVQEPVYLLRMSTITMVDLMPQHGGALPAGSRAMNVGLLGGFRGPEGSAQLFLAHATANLAAAGLGVLLQGVPRKPGESWQTMFLVAKDADLAATHLVPLLGHDSMLTYEPVAPASA